MGLWRQRVGIVIMNLKAKIIGGILALCFILSGCAAKDAADQETKYDATYYLVRHAEKILGVKDPPLTQEGYKRADDLAQRLDGIDLSKIYSTNYIRTLETAVPTANAKSLETVLYDPNDLEGFAQKLLSETGTILIVGHSNTTPDLAKYLGSEPGPDIVEASEYDRLYIIRRQGAKVSGEITRFGD
jgi:phosphohistidine phosphatase SixA